MPALLVTAAVSVLATVAALALWGRLHYARHLSLFRCRVGPPTGRRRARARWRLRRTWATWIGDELVVRSGALRLWLTPLAVGVPLGVTVEALEPGEVRGLGKDAVALRFALRGGGALEIAVGAGSADRLVGPFLTAALPGLSEERRERGG
jgi:hypothetical protein